MIPLLAPLLLLMAGASVPQRAAGPDAHAPAAEDGDFVIYETAPGDTLAGLADAHFRDPEYWRRARAANARLLAGVDPSRPLAAGMRLRLDTAWLRRTPVKAEVIAFRGDVRVHAGGGTRPARIGVRIGEGDGVETGAVGFVTLRLPDGSEVSLPTSSAIRFDRLRRYSLNGALDRRIRLVSGGTSARVVPLPEPTSRHEVTTPVGVAAVRGTAFRVRYTPGAARASAGVLEGRVGVTAGAAPERALPAGTGLVFTAAGPGPVTRLPAPPVALDMPALQAGARAQFAVRADPGLSFRAVVATDPAMRDPLAEAESADGRFAIEGLPAGRYHLEVTTVTADGLEGFPARFSFDVPERSAMAAAAGGGAAGPAPPGDPESGPGGELTARMVSGNLDEGLAALGQPVARVFAETFGGNPLEEGDSSEGITDAMAGTGGDRVALWSLGPAPGPRMAVPAASGWAGFGGGAVGPAMAPLVPAVEPSRPPSVLPALPVPSLPPGSGPGLPVVVPGPFPSAPAASPLPVPVPEAVPAAALVPEPATWAFLITGFGMVGLGLRARRSRRDAGSGRAGAP